MFFTCRNGRFLLHSSNNIITPSAVVESEEALNQGSMIAAEVFIRLRSRSILHLFACIGRFIGLEVIAFIFLFSLSLSQERARDRMSGL